MSTNNYTRPASSRRLWPMGLAVLIALGGLAFYVFQATRPRPAAVERRDIVGYVSLKGRAIAPPSAYAEVRAPYVAPVDKVYSTLGAHVRRGDVLVELANAPAHETYEAARQNVRLAETAYANAKQQYDSMVNEARKQAETARNPSSSSQ